MADIRSIITEAAQRYGVSPQLMLRIAQIESGMNPNSANPNSSARGLYQFMTKPGGSWGQYGGGQNPLDPVANADAGARYIRDNIGTLKTKLGRNPDDWEVYLAHQQGRAGAPALLANPNRPAAEVLQAFYSPKIANDAVVLNGGRPGQLAGDFAHMWKAKYEGTAAPPPAPRAPDISLAGAGDDMVRAAPAPRAAPPPNIGLRGAGDDMVRAPGTAMPGGPGDGGGLFGGIGDLLAGLVKGSDKPAAPAPKPQTIGQGQPDLAASMAAMMKASQVDPRSNPNTVQPSQAGLEGLGAAGAGGGGLEQKMPYQLPQIGVSPEELLQNLPYMQRGKFDPKSFMQLL